MGIAETTSGQNNMGGKTLTEQERHWLNHFKRYQSSGLSLAAYARSQKLVVNTFYGWHVKLKDRNLIPVEPVATVFHRAEVKQTEAPPIGNDSLSLRFRLPNGIECELAGTRSDTCTRFLEILARLNL